ncbi:MAG: hypothetical protein LBM99_00640 [Bacillales bacterium]|jgi:hypothetical protein|nr:hypothetical protein [Bacillales bacterium]
MWETIIIVGLVVIFVGFIVGRAIYKRIKKQPSGECACCAGKGDKLVERYRKSNK